MFFLYRWYLLIVYQPLLNILLGTYGLADKALRQDINLGTVLIALTLLFRLFWLPVSIASGRSYKEKKAIEEQLGKIKEQFSHNPQERKQEIQKANKISKTTAFFSSLNLIVHTLITIALIRLFGYGIEKDTNLLYSFVTKPSQINVLFSNTQLLNQRSWFLSLILALCVFLYEVITSQLSYNKSRQDVKIQIGLPIIAFITSLFIPSGATLFLITTLSFSVIFTLVKQLYFWNLSLGEKTKPTAQPQAAKEEKTVAPAK